MKRSTVVVVMIAMLVAAPGSVSAQSLAEGSRVRVKTPDSKSVGTLTEKTEQQLTLRLENGSEIQVPWVNVERLDMSLGKKGNLGKGALIGLGAGVLVGIVVAQNDCEGSSFVFESESECTGFAALFFIATIVRSNGGGKYNRLPPPPQRSRGGLGRLGE